MTQPIDLAALSAANAERRRRKAAATKGPWRDDGEGGVRYGEEGKSYFAAECYSDWPENAAFIAAARNDPVEDEVDALLDEVERLRLKLENRLGEYEGILP